MKSPLIVGVDVSKDTLDFFFMPSEVHYVFPNDSKGFKKWQGVLKKISEDYSDILVIMEHTGHYSFRFEQFLLRKIIPYCKIPALEIKRSIGVIRGKNDKVDSQRIAQYGWLRKDILDADAACPKDVLRLKDLVSLRQKLVRDRSSYLSRQKMMKQTGKTHPKDRINKVHRVIIDQLTRQIQIVETDIKEVIKSNADFLTNYRLLISIKGIGFVIGAFMIANTHNFTRFANARKYNCYAGLAPFSDESGSSRNKRHKVSHLANKQAKTLLNRAASTAIQHDQELKQYYHNRLARGKQKKNSLNVVMAKLVSRMFAIVKRQTPYKTLPIAA